MIVPAGTSRSSSRVFFLPFAVTVTLLLLLAPGQAQRAAPKPSPGSVSQKANPATEAGRALGSRPSDAPQVLQQLNSALEGLVAKVSPAVVRFWSLAMGRSRKATALRPR